MLRDVRGYKQIVKKHLLETLKHCGGPCALSQHMVEVARKYSFMNMATASARFYFLALLLACLNPKFFAEKGYEITKALGVQSASFLKSYD